MKRVLSFALAYTLLITALAPTMARVQAARMFDTGVLWRTAAPTTPWMQVTQMFVTCAGTNDTSAFSTAIAAIGANNGTIQLPYKAATRCAVNTLSIPANVTLDNAVGTGIKVNTGQTLTILGPINNPDDKQIFYNATAGLGTVSLAGNVRVGKISPKWWGATGDGLTSDSAAFQATTLAGANRRVQVTPGTYLISDVDVPANSEIVGVGMPTLKLAVQTTTGDPIFTVTGNNTTFRDFKVDGQRVLQVTYPAAYAECECYENLGQGGAGAVFRSGIRVDAGTLEADRISGFSVENVAFENMFGASIALRNVSDVVVDRATQLNSYSALVYAYAGSSTLYGTNYKITRNRVEDVLRYNAFILDSIKDLTFSSNTLKNINRGMKIEGGTGGRVFGNYFENVVSCDNTDIIDGIHMCVGGAALNVTSPTATGCGEFEPDGTTPDCGIRDMVVGPTNIFKNVGEGINLYANAGGVKRVKIIGNIVYGTFVRSGSVTTGFGFNLNQSGAFEMEDITVENNDLFEVAQRFINMSVGDRVKIKGNHAYGKAAGGSGSGILVQPYAGLLLIADLEITNNTIALFTSSNTIGIANTVAGTCVYENFRLVNNFVDSGSDSNTAFRADWNTTFGGGSSADYFGRGSVISGNTFIGKVIIAQANVAWTPDNRVTATSGNVFTGLGTVHYSPLKLYGTSTQDLGVLNANTCSNITVTVTGAATGDRVTSVGTITAGVGAIDAIQYADGYVSAANTVIFQRCNPTGSASSDPPSGDYFAEVLKVVN